MDTTAGVELVRRRWRLVGIVTLLTAVIAFGGSYLWSPRYVATTNVIVKPLGARFLTSTGQDLNNQTTLVAPTAAASLGETHARLLTSRSVAVAVVDELKLDKRPTDQSPLALARHAVGKLKTMVANILIYGYYTEPTPYEAAVGAVQNGLVGTPIKDSYVVEVMASADNPELAAAVANSAAKHLVEQATQRDRADAATHRDFLKEQLARTSADVQTAEQAVSTYKQDNGLTDINTALSLDAQELKQLGNNLTSNDVQLAAARARNDELQRQINQIASVDTSSSTIATGRSTTTMTTTAANTVFAQLRSDLASASADVASLQAAHDSLVAQLAPSSTPNTLPAQEAQLRNLDLQLASANDAYKAVKSAYDGAVVDSQNGSLEISQVDQATPPLYPASPLRYLFLLIGLLVGITGGVGLAYYRDRRAFTVVSPAEQVSARKGLAPQPAYSVVTALRKPRKRSA